jgi:hypothetical protein
MQLEKNETLYDLDDDIENFKKINNDQLHNNIIKSRKM